MTRKEYALIEAHMHDLMQDSAHDKHHIYRVLYAALDIAAHEEGIDYDVLIAACLLHDIGRTKQFADDTVCHAQAGGAMSLAFLRSIGWGEEKALHTGACVSSHRYRADNPPKSKEAKILFDADKLDACGALGIARTLVYQGQVSAPLYHAEQDGAPRTSGSIAQEWSFFQEYNYKLKHIYAAFYTAHAKKIAAAREKTATAYYDALYAEITGNYQAGVRGLAGLLGE